MERPLTCSILLASWFTKMLSPSTGSDNIPVTLAPQAGALFAAMLRLALHALRSPRNLWLVASVETPIKHLSTLSAILALAATWYGTPALTTGSSMAQTLMREVATSTGLAMPRSTIVLTVVTATTTMKSPITEFTQLPD